MVITGGDAIAKDLRTFLKEYEAKYPEDVIHIDKQIGNNQEITALVAQLEKQNKYPVLVFHNVLNAEGKQSKHWVVTNVLASRTRYARICNSTFETLGRDTYEKSRVKRTSPIVIPKRQAPVKEVIKTGDRHYRNCPVSGSLALAMGHKKKTLTITVR